MNMAINERVIAKSKTWTVAVYDVDLAYGGPEEGGWYYSRGSLVRLIRVFKNEDMAYTFSQRMNRKLQSRIWGPNMGKRELHLVLSEGELQAHVYHEDLPVDHYPEYRPHYE